MVRLRDWVRFHGWRNGYWREDARRSRCSHEAEPWAVDGTFICPDCGVTVGYSLVSVTSDVMNTTPTIRVDL